MKRKFLRFSSVVLSGMLLFSSVNVTALAEDVQNQTVVEESSQEELDSSDEVNEEESEAVLEEETEEASEEASEEETEEASEEVSEEETEEVSEEVSEEETEEVSEEVSEEETEEVSEEVSEEETEEIAEEDLPLEEENPDGASVGPNGLVFDDTDIANGSYKGIDWTIKSSGILVVKGTGDFAVTGAERKCSHAGNGTECSIPWHAYADDIKSVLFQFNDCTDMSYMFSGCKNLSVVVTFNEFSSDKVTTMKGMFYGCTSLSVDMSAFDTSSVTDMSKMFYSCTGLQVIDFTECDTSNVTDMSEMFYGCNGAYNITLTGLNTAKVTNMAHMFDGCTLAGTLDVSSFNTAKVTNMEGMFANCAVKELNLKGFNTAAVTNMSGMFKNATRLTALDCSSFNTVSVTDMSEMFSGCSRAEQINVSSFNTAKVKKMDRMFNGCEKLSDLDLSSFNMAATTSAVDFLTKCKGLETIFSPKNLKFLVILPGDDFSWLNNLNKVNMFELPMNSSKSVLLTYGYNVKPTWVTYALNGGENHSDNPAAIGYYEKIKLKNPTKAGYTFLGWFDENSDKKVTSVDFEHRNLIAKWKPNKYTISYKTNSGAFAKGVTKVTSFTPETEEIILPTKEQMVRANYTFAGWYTDKEFTQKIETIPAGSVGNKTLYAKWEGYNYNVLFRVNLDDNLYGEFANTAEYGVTYQIPSDVCDRIYKAYPDYVITSWNTQKDGKGKKVTSIKNLALENDTVAVFAIMEPAYKVVCKNSANEVIETYRYKKGTTYKLPKPVKDGYTFAGWEEHTENGNVKVTSVKDTDKELYATWKVNTYSITYKTNGGSLPSSAVKKYTIEDSAISLEQPSKAYYHFKGWYYDAKFTQPVGESIPAGSIGNKTLYAKWEGITYYIQYNVNNMKDGRKQIVEEVHYGDKVKLLDASKLEFYNTGTHPVAWNHNTGGWNSVRYKFGATVSNLTKVENDTFVLGLYSEQNDYTIKFEANGGIGKMSPIKTKGAWSVTLPESKFTREGCYQAGWIDEYGRVYGNGEKVLNICETHKGTITLKPRWKRLT